MRAFLVFAIAAIMCVAQAQVCSHQHDPAFYEKSGYTIRKINLVSPFDFVSLVRSRLDVVKTQLKIKEGAEFSEDNYNDGFTTVNDAVTADSSLGKDSPVKIVVVTLGLENCQDTAGALTVDVVYRIFSTDPLPATNATPEQRRAMVKAAATTTVATSLSPRYEIVPRFSYDHTTRGFGGLDASLSLPNHFLDKVTVSAAASSSARNFVGELHGSGQSSFAVLARMEYTLAYRFYDVPALNLRLTKGVGVITFAASSKDIVTKSSQVRLRYGVAAEYGIQQSNSPNASSRYGAATPYAGMTRTTRYSEAVVSYGLSANGAGFSNLTYVRQIGDVSYSRRFPGGTNRPWDVETRFTAGGISGTGPVLINDRFFGGNTVGKLVANSDWQIPTGPIIRSIPTNRMAGSGSGGTSFYSTNFTVGKVLIGWPLIPPEVETAPGFSDGVNAAENTAQTWFADDYESASPQFKVILEFFPPKLKADVDAVRATFASIRSAGALSADVTSALRKGDNSIAVSMVLINTASDTTLRGADRAARLRAWLTPVSALVKLTKILEQLETLAPGAGPELKAERTAIESDLANLRGHLDAIHTGPAHQQAVDAAARYMARPREVIDTLRHEVNRYSFSVVGIIDFGRLWPDPLGTRYALGGGGRFSLVNVNFNLGYAFNPHPEVALGQGRGALFFSLTYTNLFQ